MTQAHERADSWFHTGDPNVLKPIWYMHPERTSFTLDELKWQTTNICRYNGGLRWYLVQHLALGVLLCRQRFGTDHIAVIIAGYYAAHDLHEAIAGDMVSGMKKYVPEYKVLEDKWERHIHDQIGLPLDMSVSKKAVHELDMMALVTEMTAMNHPAAHLAVEGTGIAPKYKWIDTLWEVHAMTGEECWNIVTSAINNARKELTNGEIQSR